MSANVALVERLCESVKARDYDSFRKLCAPDLEWRQSLGCPGGGCWHGPDEVVERVFEALTHEWTSFGYRTDEMIDAGNSVVVLGVYEVCHRDTHKCVRAAAAHVYDIVDGKVTRCRQLADTAKLDLARSA